MVHDRRFKKKEKRIRKKIEKCVVRVKDCHTMQMCPGGFFAPDVRYVWLSDRVNCVTGSQVLIVGQVPPPWARNITMGQNIGSMCNCNYYVFKHKYTTKYRNTLEDRNRCT